MMIFPLFQDVVALLLGSRDQQRISRDDLGAVEVVLLLRWPQMASTLVPKRRLISSRSSPGAML
jgi:hypothetical protein